MDDRETASDKWIGWLEDNGFLLFLAVAMLAAIIFGGGKCEIVVEHKTGEPVQESER